MVTLFRRFRKEKKEESTSPESAPAASEPSAPEPAPPAATPEPASPAAAEPTPEPDSPPSGPPPPLPTAPPVLNPTAAVPAGAECFLCGTPLQGHFCPKCQMTWAE